MIIDCHGHYATEPKGLLDYRRRQVAAFAEGKALAPDFDASDDEIRATPSGISKASRGSAPRGKRKCSAAMR